MDITGARVLIVDDNDVNRAILSEQMASWRFDACAVESGVMGIQVLKAAASQGLQVDCVVLDYQMPGMTGAEMARLVRATPQIRDVPIVMLTSVDQSLGQAQFRDLFIDAQLIKPVRSSLLLETLVTTIQKGRSRGVRPAAPVLVERAVQEPAAAVTPAEAAALPPAAAPATPVAKPAPKAEGGLDILVAEDNEVNQLVFTQILSETAHRFHIVGNGELAVAACKEMRPRMILMDVSMPTMNGLEATAAIRAHEAQAGTHVPIVGVTAHALKGDRERCLEAGMDDYLSKPISPDALLRKVATWLDEAGAEGRRAG
jgi:CheY-like chemotaxis protein